MIRYKKVAEKQRKIRGFEYDRKYTLDEVADKLGFNSGTAKDLFYAYLIKHGIITSYFEPTFLSFMTGLLQWPKSRKGEKIVSYYGTVIIGDLLEAYEVCPPE